MIGRRLKVARAACGLSLRDLSAQIENRVTAQAIGKYERNEDMPSSGVVIALAGALNIPVDYLLSEDGLELEGVEFRKKPSASAREEAAIEAHSLHFLERYLAIEDLLQMRSVDWEVPRSAPHHFADVRDAEDAARSVREDWGLGNDPIPQLSELLEERGIKVLSLELENIDGLAAKVRRKSHMAARVIVVNQEAWAERKRFTLAHELGHMVLAPPKGMKELDIEKAANRFAGAFLIPADILRAEMGANRSSVSLGELMALKKRFGVSMQAIAYRCKDLGIIGPKAFSQIFKVFVQRGWRKPPYQEPGSMRASSEEPKRFHRLCYRALAENLISDSKAAELLGVSVRDLDLQLDNPVA